MRTLFVSLFVGSLISPMNGNEIGRDKSKSKQDFEKVYILIKMGNFFFRCGNLVNFLKVTFFFQIELFNQKVSFLLISQRVRLFYPEYTPLKKDISWRRRSGSRYIFRSTVQWAINKLWCWQVCDTLPATNKLTAESSVSQPFSLCGTPKYEKRWKTYNIIDSKKYCKFVYFS